MLLQGYLLARKIHHAAETQMVGSGIGFAFAARSDYVARAILVGAQK
jgi:hypothetical protein